DIAVSTRGPGREPSEQRDRGFDGMRPATNHSDRGPCRPVELIARLRRPQGERKPESGDRLRQSAVWGAYAAGTVQRVDGERDRFVRLDALNFDPLGSFTQREIDATGPRDFNAPRFFLVH